MPDAPFNRYTASGTGRLNNGNPNAYYAAQESQWTFRLAQNLQPTGALLIIVGLSAPLRELARRSA